MIKTPTDIKQISLAKPNLDPSNDIILNSGEAVPLDTEDKFAAPATSDSIESQPELSSQTIMTAPSAAMMVNAEGKITLWSVPAAEIFGYSSSDTVGQMFYSIITLPKFYEASKRAFNTFIQTAQRQLPGITLELPARSQNGREFFVEMSWTALEIQGEKHVLANIKDISERKQWEKQQRQLQEAHLVNEVLALVTEHKDLPSILSGICRCMAAFYQVPKSAFALLDDQQTQAKVIAEYCTPALPGSIGQIVPVTHNPSMAYLLQHKVPLAIKDAQHDPRLAPVHAALRHLNIVSILLIPILIGDRVVGTMEVDSLKTREFGPQDTDVAQRIAAQIGLALQRKQAALELHAAKEYAEQLFYTAPSAVITVDPKGIITGCNQKAVELVGYRTDDLLGQSCLKFALTPCSQSCGLFDDKVPKPIRGAECQLQTRDGRVLTVVKSAVLLKDADGQIVGGIESFEDITEQKNTETRLGHSLSLLESTLEATADGILVVDRKGNIILHNRRLLEMCHMPDGVIADLKEQTLLSFVQKQLIQPDQFVAKINELYTQPTAESLDILTFKDGRIFERLSRPQRIGDEIVGRVWSFHDVTAQRLAEQSLRLTQFSIDKVPQAVFWLGQQGHILNANEGASRMLGYSREELLEMTVFDYNPTVSREEFDLLWQKLRQQRSLVIESEHLTKTGGRYPVEVRLNILEYQGHEFVFSFGSDITDRKIMEVKQKEQLKQEALLHQVTTARATHDDLKTKLSTICQKTAAYYQADHAAIAFLDEGGMYADVIFEYKDLDLADSARVVSIVNILPLMDLFSLRSAVALVDVHRASFLEPVQDILREFDNTSTLLIPILLNGQPVCMLEFNWLNPMGLDEQKRKIGEIIANQISQIIQQHRAEIALHEQRTFAQQVMEYMRQGLIVIRNDWSIEYANPAFADLLGYELTDLLERSILDMVYKANLQLVEEIAAGWQKGEIQEREIVFKHLSGKPVFVLLSGVPRWHNGQIDGAIAVMTDLSSRIKIEKEQALARDQALEASRLKSEFLANMSHEIRTPLNAVIGMTSLLFATTLDNEQRDYAETIRSSGDILLSLINDILDFSKIEAGKLDLEKQPVDLRDCIEEALDVVVAKASEKGLELAYIMEEKVPQAIVGDVTRLCQILVNLLNNAIKFTEKGEVILRVAPDWGEDHKEEGRQPLLRFSVQDTGIGIPEEKMNRLFQSFSQVDASTSRRFGGTGLGLAICKRLVELMGGRIWVESEVGRGATFYFTIQMQPTSLHRRSHLRSAQPLLSGKRLLIVDDNKTNRFILMRQTTAWGMRPMAVASAQEALEMLQSGENFDAAVLDMQMPQMDGLMLAREICRLFGKRPFPLMMLSSIGDREGLREEDLFAAHLTKPVKPKQFLAALRTLFDETLPPLQPVRQRELDPEMGRQHPLRILLAEDNLVNQKVTLRILERMGYRADVAANGLEVLESLQRQPYDVILMDVQMPNMDGVEATQQIREIWPVERQPAVIAMTANALTGDREKYLAAGMDHYISKPVRIQELLDTLGRVKPLAQP